MAELPENDRIAGPFIALGGQTDFPGDFPLIDAPGDPAGASVLFVRERDGATSELVVGDFTIVASTDGGFTLRLVVPALAGDRCFIVGRQKQKRLRAHPSGGAVRTPTLEDDARELAARAQEARRDLDRAVTVPLGETAPQLPKASERVKGFVTYGEAGAFEALPAAPGRFAAWDADGKPIAAAGVGADAGLREDLAAGEGAALVKVQATGGVARSVAERLADLPQTVGDFADPAAATPMTLRVPEGETAAFTTFPVKTVTGEGAFAVGVGDEADPYDNLQADARAALFATLGRLGADLSALALAIARGTVVWAWWGDSITEGESQTTQRSSFTGVIERRLRAAFPTVTWEFHNLSLPGKGIAEANSDTFLYGTHFTPTAGWQRVPPSHSAWNPPVAPTAGDTWHEIVEAVGADVVCMALTVNDTSGDSHAVAFTLNNIIQNRINFWTKVPAVLLVTPLPPSRTIDAPFDGEAVAAAINDNAIGIRAIAEKHNVSLIDLNRLWRSYSEGVDCVLQHDRYRPGLADYDAWVHTGARPAVAAGVMSTATSGFAYRDVSRRDVRLSARLSGAGFPALIYRSDPAAPATAYRVQLDESVPQVVLYYSGVAVASAAVDSAADYIVTAEASGGRHRIWVNAGAEPVIDVIDTQRLQAGRYGAGASGVAEIADFVAMEARPTSVGPAVMREPILLGEVDAPWGTDPACVGGNGINHPRPQGHQLYVAAFRPLLDYLAGLVLRPIEQEWIVNASAIAGDLALGDYLDIKVNGVTATAQITGVGNETATHLQGTTPEAIIDINDATATIQLVKNGATVLAEAQIDFGVSGAYRVYAQGSASKDAAYGVRHLVQAKARPKPAGGA